MLGMFRKTLRTGIVTSRYPDVPEAAPSAFRGRPLYAADRCDLHGECARVCPAKAITIEEGLASAARQRIWQLDYARCVFCGLCVDACPGGSLTQSNDFEVAVKQRGDLIVRAVFVDAASEHAAKENER